MKVDAILPAGGRITGAFAAEVGTEIKALIPLQGCTMLERTLQALRGTGRVERAVIIGPDELRNHPAAQAADAVLAEAETGSANVLRGLEWLHNSNDGRHAGRVLIVATDLPFLTPEAITGFLDACPCEADISLPVISRQAIEARFGGTSGRYVPLRDGVWTAGSVFLVNPEVTLRNRGHIERIHAMRKSGVKMALLLGPLLIARFLCRQATVAHVQQRCEQILGCTGAAVLNCAPELAFDIDLPEEYRYALRQIVENQPPE